MTPAHVEAERNLLGAVLVDPELLPSVALEQGDFSLPQHRALWKAMRHLDGAGTPVDAVTVKAELERRHELGGAGGAAYLGELLKVTPRVSSVVGWESVIREEARRRAVLTAGERMVAMAKAGDRGEDALEEGLRILNDAAVAVGSTVELDPVAQICEAVRDLEDARQEQAGGSSTGLPSLDARIGRLHRGQAVIVAAGTGKGKSTLLQQLGDASAEQGAPVLLVSAEMSAIEINRRRLVAASGVPASHFEPGGVTPTDRDWDAIARAAGILGKRPFYVEASAPTPLELRAKARYVKGRVGLAVVLVDYLQLLPPGPGRKGETRENEVARVSRALKRMAQDMDVLVVAACQLNRAPEQRQDGRPRLSDLRESGSLEQDADVVLLLHRPKPDEDDVEVIVAKHRQRGPGAARLRFNGVLHRFEELGG